ncbi:hypothetical protein CBW65_07485 [Tumebacillus avium]|uniref:Uncharacterized protein n=1 Tax=Tumebacillus avium TaxID=1903704 RepID=A0A1Y0IKC3_9BACL|nr:hypothetical protein [Tumebacillus avium]ARU60942.1 hypothetical protein CBW65_07485 [Tumebacillus avium]
MNMPTPAQKIPVKWVSLTCTVLSSSKYGLDYDRVKVLHEIGLQNPLQKDETFYIPTQGKAIDTRAIFPDGDIVNFAGQRFEDLQDELNQYMEAVKKGDAEKMDQLHNSFKALQMLTPVPYKAGTAVLTFDYELALYAKDNIFNLQMWAPMPSFEVVQGGQVTASVQLPSTNNAVGFRARILEATGKQLDPQGNQQAEVSKVLDQDLGLRHMIVWHWANDPLFTVKYQYQ